jgi:hypothetical protein
MTAAEDPVLEARDALRAAIKRTGRTPCQDSGVPEIWWHPRTTETAIELCGECLVRAECLACAVAGHELRYGGVWGGKVTR